MPVQYTEIKLAEMSRVLEVNGFEYYNDPNALEYVFQKYIDRNGKQYTLKLYTGIDKRTDTSRECGEDAIRLVVCGNGMHYGEGRVNRTQNWKENMRKRVMTWDTLFKPCPQCGNALKEKKSRFGKFMGCVTYPNCGYTEKKVS